MRKYTLLDAGLLRHDGDHPHRLYSVTVEGRELLGERYRQGIDYGHGQGDLGESSQHVAMAEAARRYLERECVDNHESDVVEVVPYYELREGGLPAAAFMGDDDEAAAATNEFDRHRLDVVGLDEDGEIIVTVEAERVNNDLIRATPDDFDKMAACDPEEAIWVVLSQSDGHEVLEALNDPAEGPPRVEKTYSTATPTQDFRIDTDGFTDMYPMTWLQKQCGDDESSLS